MRAVGGSAILVSMCLRTTQRKDTNGSIVRYVQLAHNRCVEGVTQAEVLVNLGREDRFRSPPVKHPHRYDGYLYAVLHAELAEDVRHVDAGCLGRDEQLGSNLGV